MGKAARKASSARLSGKILFYIIKGINGRRVQVGREKAVSLKRLTAFPACQYCGKTAQYVSLTYLYTDRFVFKQTGSALSFIYSLIPTRWRAYGFYYIQCLLQSDKRYICIYYIDYQGLLHRLWSK